MNCNMLKKALTASLWLLVLLWLIVSPATSVSAFAVVSPASNINHNKIRPSTGTLLQMSLTSKQEIEVIAKPDPAFLEEKGVFGWGTWGCDISTFPWTYREAEFCYLLKGKVIVTPDCEIRGESVTIQAGNFVTFPAGLSCTWDVLEPVVVSSPSNNNNHKESLPSTGTFLQKFKQEIEVIAELDPSFLEKKGVFDWGTWGCGISKFPWTYREAEFCYLLKGKVIVTPDCEIRGEPVTIQAGNFVTFPAGLSCTWDVLEPVVISSPSNNNNNHKETRPTTGTFLQKSLSSPSKQEMEVIVEPGQAFLEEKGVIGWGTWGCDISTFPWTYSEAEFCYLLKGKVIVTPDCEIRGEPLTVQAGNFVTFPAGFSCTWDVLEPVVVSSPSNNNNHKETRPTTGTSLQKSLSSPSKQEIEVIAKPDQAFLEEKGVIGWGTWGCDISTFPWTYSEAEFCYLLKGKVIVTPDCEIRGEPLTIQAGNFVTFPAGFSCTWDVLEPVVVSSPSNHNNNNNNKETRPTTGTSLQKSLSSPSKQEIEVIAKPDQAFLEEKGVIGWGTWGCDISTFPWTYSEAEFCYLLKGKVIVTPDCEIRGEPLTVQAGNFVTFPAGFSCTWDVLEPVVVSSPSNNNNHKETRPTTGTSLQKSLSSSSKQEIEVIAQPDLAFLEKKGVFGWDRWGCGISTFPWKYDKMEFCYLLKGKVIVTPDCEIRGEPVTIQAGNFVTFPAGMSCTWDVLQPVEKHFMFY